MEEFSFLHSIKQYKKTYAELLRLPKIIFEQPIFGWTIVEKSKIPIKYAINIDDENYEIIPSVGLSYFFANNNVKITFPDKSKTMQPFILKWCGINDIITKIKSIPNIHEIGINENSLCSLFIEISGAQGINLYNDTNIPQEILHDIEKKRCMQILQNNTNEEIAISQLPWLYEIKEKLESEIVKIDNIISKFNIIGNALESKIDLKITI